MDPRYPIGKFSVDEKNITEACRKKYIQEINEFPDMLAEAVSNFNDEKLNTHYRDGGWTVRQVIHHVADSHMNAYIRIRLALTENNPTIKPYEEQKWAELFDAKTAHVEVSLNIIKFIHQRWVMLLNSLTESDFNKTFNHPQNGITTIDKYIALYAWHGKHHLAHITTLAKKMNWLIPSNVSAF